jgi:RNA polymerase sigma factor (sigma-70 family)
MTATIAPSNLQLFQEFYSLQGGKLRSFLIARVGLETGKDLFQDVMVALLQKDISAVENLENYAWITAKNMVNRYYRHNTNVENHQASLTINPPSSTVNGQQIVNHTSILEYVESVLKNCTQTESTVFKMYFSEEFTLKEISENLEMPLSTVSYIKNTVQEKIYKAIKKETG